MPRSRSGSGSERVPESRADPWHPAWAWGLCFLVLFTLAVRFAEPVRDGDLWWQMAYGRYMLQNTTLVPDHSLFNWTPTDESRIYCAWVAEIFLYLLYEWTGLTGLFFFRYLCLLTFVFVVMLFARRLGIASHPLMWLICLLGVLMSYSAAFIKPEIFSYVLMTLLVAIWWKIKSVDDEQTWQCYLLPLVMVVWVNSHGGFIFGLVFLGSVALGEALNSFSSSSERLSGSVRRNFWIALALSAASTLITPYGWRYPFELTRDLVGQSMAEFETVSAYISVFNPDADPLHLKDYLIVALLILVPLLVRRFRGRDLDWSVLLSNLVFALLYARFLRTTYFFGRAIVRVRHHW